MKQFLKYTLATVAGLVLVALILGLFGFLSVVATIAGSDDKPSLKDNTVLRIKLTGSLAERAEENPLSALMGSQGAEEQGLDDLLAAIKVAKENKHVCGIYLEGGDLETDIANREEIYKSLMDFKKSGKFILSYADTYTQGNYYLASTANKLLINPSGIIDWRGMGSQPIFFTDLLKKLGVKMQVFKVGTYKSAVESFILTSMSEANREQVTSYLNDIWKRICADVSAARGIPADTLNSLAERYATFMTAEEYQKAGLVDSVCYIDGVRDCLRALSKSDKVNFVEPAKLAKLDDKADRGDDKIAVYYAEGDIVDTESSVSLFSPTGPHIVGSTVVEDLDKLAQDDDVKAVVLRINSGGGSATASEQMWRAIQLLKKKKPVVVSMGGAAASGGYYMSCGADCIFAESTTLTGSIGIFGLIPDASELLTDKLGLHFDVVKTNEASDFGAPGRAFNEKESAAIQQHVNRGYSLFLSRVAEGRGMKMEDVDRIGQGRVWTGNQALARKLVDKIGTLDMAIAEAARRAKMKDYSIEGYPAPASWMDRLASQTKEDDYLERKLQKVMGVYYEPLSFIANMKGNDWMQARMFYIPNIH